MAKDDFWNQLEQTKWQIDQAQHKKLNQLWRRALNRLYRKLDDNLLVKIAFAIGMPFAMFAIGYFVWLIGNG